MTHVMSMIVNRTPCRLSLLIFLKFVEQNKDNDKNNDKACDDVINVQTNEGNTKIVTISPQNQVTNYVMDVINKREPEIRQTTKVTSL